MMAEQDMAGVITNRQLKEFVATVERIAVALERIAQTVQYGTVATRDG